MYVRTYKYYLNKDLAISKIYSGTLQNLPTHSVIKNVHKRTAIEYFRLFS